MRGGTVLISGAGIAGPTAAYWLREHGFTPTLVERAPAPRRGGYMIDFWGVGYDVAERMGLLPVLHRDGYRITEVRLVNARGARVAWFDAAAFRRATNDRFVSILRGDLAHRLYELIDGRVETMFGDAITDLAPDANGVTVGFAHAPPRQFDIVIGADGLHSTVRVLALGPDVHAERELGYYTAAFSVDGYEPRDEGAYVSYATKGRQVARYALRDGRTAFFLVFASDEPQAVEPHDVERQRDVLRRVFAGAGWECDAILDASRRADDLYFDAVAQTQLRSWSRGRVVLVGDAAYCPSLLAGQGAAFAIAGAYLLAGALASAADHESAFAAYQRVFQPFVEAKQRAARRFGGWFAPRTELGVLLRNLATNLARAPLVGDWLLARSFADRIALPSLRAS